MLSRQLLAFIRDVTGVDETSILVTGGFNITVSESTPDGADIPSGTSKSFDCFDTIAVSSSLLVIVMSL